MCDYQDITIEAIELIDRLRAEYGNEINENITSVELSQTSKVVSVKFTWMYETDLGRKTIINVMDLDFIRETYDEPLDIAPQDGNPFDRVYFAPQDNIEDNAIKFISDKETLKNTTPLFD